MICVFADLEDIKEQNQLLSNMLHTLDSVMDTIRGSLCLFSDFYQMYSVTYYNYIILYLHVLNNGLL